MGLFNQGGKNQAPGIMSEGVYAPLAGVDYVILDQEEHWWDLMPCCNGEARFNVYATNQNLVFNKYPKPPPLLGQYTENSDFCARQFFRSCRKFTGAFKLGNTIVGRSIAPLKCHCVVPSMTCPCDRPEIYISESTDRLLGTLKLPGYGPLCCAIGENTCPLLEIEMFDNQGNLRFRIKAECCQKGQMCYPCRACGCEAIDYIIYDQNSQPTGGFIKNMLNECMTEVFTSADKYAIGFPPNCFPQDKLILIHAAIWIDYLQYRA